MENTNKRKLAAAIEIQGIITGRWQSGQPFWHDTWKPASRVEVVHEVSKEDYVNVTTLLLRRMYDGGGRLERLSRTDIKLAVAEGLRDGGRDYLHFFVPEQLKFMGAYERAELNTLAWVMVNAEFPEFRVVKS